MDLSQAIECASALTFPGFLTDDAALAAERARNEDALVTLMAAWRDAAPNREPCDYGLIRELADRNRDVCDRYGIEKLRDVSPSCLSRSLGNAELIHAVAVLQHKTDAQVTALAGPDARDLNVAWVDAPVSGMVVGIDIETTDRDPARGYIINVGLEFMTVGPKAKPHDPFAGYFGLPEMYAEKGVPLADIHKIQWSDLEGRRPFREDSQVQAALLAALTAYPFMAHNAAFEDSWFMLHIDGYAEARKAGRVVPIDTRDICRRVDPETKILPHEQRPASLESWARRRGTLKAGESERHLGLDDVELMLATVQAEFAARNML
ncbi:MAG TPA: 3'-5' exonuclease [Candidatus Olsenella stercoravium]|uniref:3'-5' exonuclease n=1 Tax=Candidatus Olsenella stercoravium TaxID=2838713 RepID=A0A9D2IPY7_9ACTN|nr:3'-5' exonuclease [Candidatus Olsenella stercoravium]